MKRMPDRVPSATPSLSPRSDHAPDDIRDATLKTRTDIRRLAPLLAAGDAEILILTGQRGRREPPRVEERGRATIRHRTRIFA